MAAFNPWAGFGQQQFPPGFGGFGGVPQFQNGMGNPWGQMQFQTPDQGMQQAPPGFGGGPQAWLPDQGINQVPPGGFGGMPPQGGGPQLGGVGGAPVGGGSQYPDWFVEAGRQNGMNPRQMEVEWQRFMQSQGGGGRPADGGGGGGQAPPMYQPRTRDEIDPRDPNRYGFDENGNINSATFIGWNPNSPMPSGQPGVPRGGYGQMGSPRQFDPSRTGGPRGNEGGKVGGGGPQVGMIGGSPVGDWNLTSGRLSSGGKDMTPPSGQEKGSGKWQYHANGTRTWKPNKPKPAAKPTATRPPIAVKPGPVPPQTDPPEPGPSISANNDVVKTKGGTQTPPIYVPGSEARQSSGSMPSIAASMNKRRY